MTKAADVPRSEARFRDGLALAFASFLPLCMSYLYFIHLRGSENNDAFVPRDGGIGIETNRHGGMLGGISSGEPIVCRVAIKPTSSLPQPQRTVTRAGVRSCARSASSTARDG